MITRPFFCGREPAKLLGIAAVTLIVVCFFPACSGEEPGVESQLVTEPDLSIATECRNWDPFFFWVDHEEPSWEEPFDMLICPDGDGHTLDELGQYFELYLDYRTWPLCEGHTFTLLIDADSNPRCVEEPRPNDDPDWALREFKGSWIGGGWVEDDNVSGINAVEIEYEGDPGNPHTVYFKKSYFVTYNSPDINADGVVNTADLSAFSILYANGVYDWATDLNHDGIENTADVGKFAQHYGHGMAGSTAPTEKEMKKVRKLLAELMRQ